MWFTKSRLYEGTCAERPCEGKRDVKVGLYPPASWLPRSEVPSSVTEGLSFTMVYIDKLEWRFDHLNNLFW